MPLASDLFTVEQLTEYFAQISHGVGPDLAARAMGTTGTKMRMLRRRDPEFAARFDAATEEGRVHYEDRLRAQARLRALHQTNPSDRMLEVELATHVPGYEHLRRDRVKIDGRLEHAIVLDPGALDQLPIEELMLLRELLSKLGGEVIDARDVRELGPGE